MMDRISIEEQSRETYHGIDDEVEISLHDAYARFTSVLNHPSFSLNERDQLTCTSRHKRLGKLLLWQAEQVIRELHLPLKASLSYTPIEVILIIEKR